MKPKTNSGKSHIIPRKLIYVWIISTLIAVVLISCFGTNLIIDDQTHAVNFLNANIGFLVTILAVTMSFTLLGLQFLVESYTLRMLGTFMKDKVIYGFSITYICLISLNLISVVFPSILDPIRFIQFAIIGTIFSLIYLVILIYYIVGKIQPEKIIIDTFENISNDVLKEIIKNKGLMGFGLLFRPFVILEQVLIKTINKNDVVSYIVGLHFLFNKLEEYLEYIQNEFLTHKDFLKRGDDSYYVYSFFFQLFSQLFTECVTHHREQFIMRYQYHLFNIFGKLHTYKHKRAMDDFWERIVYVGNKIFEFEMIEACNDYLRLLEYTMEIEFELVKKHKDFLSYVDPNTQTDEEIKNELLVDDFSNKQIKILTTFAMISIEKKNEKLIIYSNLILKKILLKSLQLKDDYVRQEIVHKLLDSLGKIHKASLVNNIHSLYGIQHLEQYLDKLDPKHIDEMKKLTKYLCEIEISDIQSKNFYEITFEIREFGATCRHIENKYPTSAIIILEYLNKLYEIIQNMADDENKSKYLDQIIKEIESAEKWNKNHHINITKKVNEILKLKIKS